MATKNNNLNVKPAAKQSQLPSARNVVVNRSPKKIIKKQLYKFDKVGKADAHVVAAYVIEHLFECMERTFIMRKVE